MRLFIAGLLRRIGLLRADLLTRVTDRMPADNEVWSGELVVVESGGFRKWACMKCPGGCGMKISLSLNANLGPRWRVTGDWFGRPSIEPSVHQMNECRCHFWVRSGQVEWCPDGPSSPANRIEPKPHVRNAQQSARAQPARHHRLAVATCIF
jgi:hypothetical protein